MERKLVKQGRNALTVTLPAKWLQHKGLRPGDSVFLEEEDNKIVVSPSRAAAKTEVTVDARGLNVSMAYHIMSAKYIEGYDTITVMHDNPALIQGVASQFIGMIIEEHTPTHSVLKSIIAVPEENFEAVLRRAAHLFLQQARTVEALAQRKVAIDEVKAVERLLDNTILYCLRYLSKYERTQQAYRHFLIASTLELAGDQLTRVARNIGKQTALAGVIVKGVEEYVRLLFTNDLKRIYTSLRSFRDRIGKKTFADGLAYTLAEMLYNYLGYVVEQNHK